MAIEYLKICDFTEVITGGTPSTKKSEYWGGTIPWLPSGVCQNCSVFDAKTFITQEGLDNSAAKMIPINSVLIALTGATAGKVAYLQMEATANQSISAIVPSEKHIPKYLFYYLLYRRDKTLSDCYGGAQKHISQEYVKNIIVPLPSLEKQTSIACELDYTNELIDKRKEQLRKLDELVKARFVELFDVQKCQRKPLGECTDFVDYRGHTPELSDTGTIRMVNAKSVGKGFFKYVDEYVTEDTYNSWMHRGFGYPGDILFVTEGHTFGNTCLIPDDLKKFALGQRVITIKGHQGLLNAFLCSYMQTDMFWQDINVYRTGGTAQGIRSKDLVKVYVPIPPMELQEQFAAFVEQTDKSKLEVQKSLEKLELLKKALMQKYFG